MSIAIIISTSITTTTITIISTSITTTTTIITNTIGALELWLGSCVGFLLAPAASLVWVMVGKVGDGWEGGG